MKSVSSVFNTRLRLWLRLRELQFNIRAIRVIRDPYEAKVEIYKKATDYRAIRIIRVIRDPNS